MKIVLIHYSALPVVGGVESVMGHHARSMADAGHEVRIVAGRGGQVDARVPFVHLPLADSRDPEVAAAKAELDAGRVPAGFADLVRRLKDALRPILAGADRVIAHNVCSLNKNLALTAALHELSAGAPARMILWHHDLAWTTPRYRSELHDGHPWDLLRRPWPGVRQVVVSELRRTELAGLFGIAEESITVVDNGVDIAGFHKLEERTRGLLGRLDLLEAAPLVLMPVRITRRKNLELGLGTLAALREKFPHATSVVTGPLGPHNPANLGYFEQLLALRRELGLDGAAHFLAELSDDFLPDEVISDFYHLADVLLLPSLEEGFGIPVLEAGLAGLPVFCSDIPTLRKLGGEHATYFSPAADPRDVAALIAARLESDPTYGLRAEVRRRYAWERIYTRQIAPLLES